MSTASGSCCAAAPIRTWSTIRPSRNTALHVVADLLFEERSPEIVRELSRAGADANRQNGNGQTPLHLAARHGHRGIIAALLRGGANPDATNREGLTPLAVVLAEDTPRETYVESARALLQAGANPNRKGREGGTPLHAAVRTTYQAFEFVEVLLAASANPCLEDGGGSIPHDLASADDVRDLLARANGFRDLNPVPTVFLDDPPRQPQGCGPGRDELELALEQKRAELREARQALELQRDAVRVAEDAVRSSLNCHRPGSEDELLEQNQALISPSIELAMQNAEAMGRAVIRSLERDLLYMERISGCEVEAAERSADGHATTTDGDARSHTGT